MTTIRTEAAKTPKRGSALERISAPPASSNELIGRALVTFAEICQREVTPELVAIWTGLLGDVPQDRLHAALNRLLLTWRRNSLPTPGDVLAQFDEANNSALSLEALSAWERLLRYLRWNFNSDLGFSPKAPPLDSATEHAMLAAGGPRWLVTCDESELQWAQKRFCEDYIAVHDPQKIQDLIGDREAKEILGRITNQSRVGLFRGQASADLSEAEILQRSAELQRQAAEIRQKYESKLG